MIVVTDIKYFEVEGDEHKLYQTYFSPYDLVRATHSDGTVKPVSFGYVTEHIKGRRFQRRDKEWIVGLSNEVADIFQLQDSAWQTMEKELGLTLGRSIQLNTDLTAAKNELDAIKNADWKTRLKWLFKGYTR